MCDFEYFMTLKERLKSPGCKIQIDKYSASIRQILVAVTTIRGLEMIVIHHILNNNTSKIYCGSILHMLNRRLLDLKITTGIDDDRAGKFTKVSV